VSVEAEARMGHGRKPRSPDTCQIKPTDRHQALAADFFDSIGHERSCRWVRADFRFTPDFGRSRTGSTISVQCHFRKFCPRLDIEGWRS
jgi:hypothetical protein